MTKTERRDHTPEKKAEIVRRHLVDHVPVSDLCDEYKIAPSLFYTWQKQVLDAMSSTLEHGARRNAHRESARLREAEERIAALEARLAKKDAVIAEISEEYVALKKELGEI
jgi:transposase-like protein